MKLVQLLAKELKGWPEGAKFIVQDENKNVWHLDKAHDLSYQDSEWKSKERFDLVLVDGSEILINSLASDNKTSKVTQEQWQAEREKMNKPKWIRHRGGKCPVPRGTKVETRHRDGNTYSPHFHTQNSRSEVATNVVWRHQGNELDIMAYRIIEETKDQEIEEVIPKHMAFGYASKEEMVAQIGEECPFAQVASAAEKTNFGTITYKLEIDATEATKEIDSLVAKWGQIESPLKWRDAIIHCQAIIEDCEREIERNVILLDAEGLMMQKDSKKAMQHYAPDVDMSDWRNWQAGDVIEIVANEGAHEFENGEEVIVVFLDLNDTDMNVKAEYKDGSDYWWLSGTDAKFIRRP